MLLLRKSLSKQLLDFTERKYFFGKVPREIWNNFFDTEFGSSLEEFFEGLKYAPETQK